MLRYPRKHRTKLLYPAGLLSLAVLPLLCIWYIAQNTYTNERALELVTYNKRWDNSTPFKVHPKRNFTQINLTENDAENRVKLLYVALQVRDLRQSNDTINGIHFHLNNTAKYSAFIKALEIARYKGGVTEDSLYKTYKTYVANGNDIWVFNYREKKIKEPEIQESMGGCLIFTEWKPSGEEINREERAKQLAAIPYHWPSGIILLSMILMVLFNVRKHFNN